MSDFRAGRLDAVRAKVAALEAGGRGDCGSLPFGDARIDARLPGGGLPLGRWHEVTGEGMEAETAAAPAAFAALLAAPLVRRGWAVWVLRRDDLHAPGLEGLGFPPERLIQVCARDDAEALGVMEDALASTGVAVVLGEVGAVDLTAGRRLQLACEKAAATGLVIRRNPFGAGSGGKAHGSAAVARWRVAAAPSAPEANLYGEVVGLGAPRWRVELEYCRGGRPGAWLFERRPFEEDIDGTHPLRLVAELGDRQLAPPQPVRAAG